MSRAYVVMTAMPPTKGHIALIEFAARVGESVEVYLQTQPGEPFIQERYSALVEATRHMSTVSIHRMHKTLPQEPDEATEAMFWDMWAGFLRDWGITEDDYIVASEGYGKELAKITGSTFIPFDMDRDVVQAKATAVRENPFGNFDQIIPEFQKYLRVRVTIFGAESTGKTTLARALAREVDGLFLPEWARPYLETVGAEITHEKMVNIWTGQRALQQSAAKLAVDKPVIVQDTDLFSTVGYWDANTWKIENGGSPSITPRRLVSDARVDTSDLYIITRSNIPFEADPLRYGGDKRELSDEWWIKFAEQHLLNYIVLNSDDIDTRLDEATEYVLAEFHKQADKLEYIREGKEYQPVDNGNKGA
jgi:HTH-type transcriptional repressor of NAD biosynthesis genes